MMLNEFSYRTGFHPSLEMYGMIEQFYADFDGDKDAFCKAYKENADGMAEKIQHAAGTESFKKHAKAAAEMEKLKKQIAELEEKLEREEEWKPYEDNDNVSQMDYDKLKLAIGTRTMSDSEAKELLYDWYGFAMDKIRIHRTIPKYEVNRHRRLRKVGEIDRSPLYNATDWNYIRFDCGCMTYELVNDNLRFFLH